MTARHSPQPIDRHPPRSGSALIVVLVLIVLLSLAAYTFSETMILENQAAEFATREARARAAAESGVEFAAVVLGNLSESDTTVNLYHDPAQFASVLVQDSPADRSRVRFSFVAPVETDPAATRARAGFIDESARWNLNALLSFDLEDEELHTLLMSIPGMTDEAADGILDWVDEDDERRQYGAEADTYEALSPPYSPANGPFESLDQLLLVQGLTPQMLYGEDANRNGLLDANENDGDISLPLDNADGLLDFGLVAYLTVHSRESNLRLDGAQKIDVNQSLLAELYDQLETEFGAEVATFITAYRMYGATNVEPLDVLSSGVSTTGDQSTDGALQAAAQGLAQQIAGGDGGVTTRGGLDPTQGGSQTIDSLYELIDAEVDAEIDGNEKTLNSPWTSDPGSLADALPLIFDALTTTASTTIIGRINLNQARREVLLGIPNMPADVVDSIVNSQLISADGQPAADLMQSHETAGWLLIEGLADVTLMRQLDRFITAHGNVYRVQVLGHFDRGGPIVRTEALIDSGVVPPKIIGRRDLSQLGPGYSVTSLVPGGTPPPGGSTAAR